MTNYNEKIKQAGNIEELRGVINSINDDILNNVEFTLNMAELEKSVKAFNEEFKNEFISKFIADYEEDRKNAFTNLVKSANFQKVVIAENDCGTIKFDDTKKSFVKFADLENAYQLYKSTETDKNGHKIKNKSVTIFGALRFYGLCDAFIRNMFIGNLTIDNEKAVNLSKVKIADKTIFDENDGKCFASNSNNALEKQLNILARFFDIDVKMLKKDLPILKLSAQKIKRDVTNNYSSINEIKTLKFVDVLFSVITSRYNNTDVAIYTNDGEKVKAVETETETTTEVIDAVAIQAQVDAEVEKITTQA